MSDRTAIYRLREVMARELDTINQYEQFADATDDPEIKALFQHLADEEKEHVMEVFEVLKLRDEAQAAWAEGSHVQAIKDNRLQDALAAGEPARAYAPAPPAAPPAVAAARPVTPAGPPVRTVGSLYGQPQI